MLLWSTGFIAAKYGLAYAPPLKFLLYRFVLVAALMGGSRARDARGVAVDARRNGDTSSSRRGSSMGVYLGGVLVAIASGMSAGMAAMLVGLQPILTVVLARGWLGERVVPRQWLGLALGLAGVWLVVRHKVALTGDGKALAAILLALVGISVGTLYQKRYCSHVDLRSGAFIQFFACAIAYAPLVLVFEQSAPIQWTPELRLRARLGWSSCCRSARSACSTGCCGMARRRTSPGLFFLVPAVTAVMAWLLFGETLDAARHRGHGADQRGRGAGAADARSGGAMTIRVPAIRSCRNWRSRIDDRPEIADGDEPGRMRAEIHRLQRGVRGERGERADPGGEIANDGGAAVDGPAVGTDEDEAPRLHGQRAASAGPRPREIEAGRAKDEAGGEDARRQRRQREDAGGTSRGCRRKREETDDQHDRREQQSFVAEGRIAAHERRPLPRPAKRQPAASARAARRSPT